MMNTKNNNNLVITLKFSLFGGIITDRIWFHSSNMNEGTMRHAQLNITLYTYTNTHIYTHAHMYAGM